MNEPSAGIDAGNAEALLFDLGQVVLRIDWDPGLAHWSRAAGIDARVLRERFRQDEAYDAHERGELTAQQYYASLRRSLGIAIGDIDFETGWNAIFTGVHSDVIEVMQRLGARLPVYAFSNTNRVHRRQFMSLYPAEMALFRRIFDSSELGMRKPEPRAFQAVVDAIGVPATRILFFDDLLPNVEAARACGLQAVHVRDSTDVTRAVAPLLARHSAR